MNVNMAEFSSLGDQIVNPGETVTFTLNSLSNRYVRWRQGGGSFLLSGQGSRCGCKCNDSIKYLVSFSANVSIPTDGTVAPISLAYSIDGATVADSIMNATPAAAGDTFMVGRVKTVPIWKGCCETVSIRNTSTVPVQVSEPNIVFERPDLVQYRGFVGGNAIYV